jgi:hypothetical protein
MSDETQLILPFIGFGYMFHHTVLPLCSFVGSHMTIIVTIKLLTVKGPLLYFWRTPFVFEK